MFDAGLRFLAQRIAEVKEQLYQRGEWGEPLGPHYR